MSKSKKKNIVYSTNSNFEYEYEEEEESESLENSAQELRIYPDRKNRKGKTVTVITGFVGTKEDLKLLEKKLKGLCGCGGSVKDGDILLQGNVVQKTSEFLKKEGCKVKVSGV